MRERQIFPTRSHIAQEIYKVECERAALYFSMLIAYIRSNRRRRQANVDCGGAAPSNGRFADGTDIISIDYDTSLIHILFCINIFCEIYATIAR